MADFELAIALTIHNEGGYVNNPNDPGGATKYGVTQNDIKNIFPETDVRDLTIAQAEYFYIVKKFWNPLYNQILDQLVGDKIFDMGVLFGVGEAIEILQLALKVDDDGLFGPITLHETNQAVPASLLQGYKTLLVQHATGIGAARPSLREFVGGWINRINS